MGDAHFNNTRAKADEPQSEEMRWCSSFAQEIYDARIYRGARWLKDISCLALGMSSPSRFGINRRALAIAANGS
jgi:hypothetical protein